ASRSLDSAPTFPDSHRDPMTSIESAVGKIGIRMLQGMVLTLTAFAQPVHEYHVKAAFLFNFARFVEWPPQTFKSETTPWHICILGRDPFGDALSEATAGRVVLGRPFALIGISDTSHAGDCQILFVSSSERRHLRSTLAELSTAGILTVGESEGFAAQGGIVNFKVEDGKVRLEINIEAAGQAHLRISSKVLNLAYIVRGAVNK
ncbi:MAG TPA: YfiR family protein, partial [Bryobacteraceae bacterium]|nr:YfiR family protein [Bryobacteraceae bacterium]